MMIAFLPGGDQSGRPPQRYLKAMRWEGEKNNIPDCLRACLLLDCLLAPVDAARHACGGRRVDQLASEVDGQLDGTRWVLASDWKIVHSNTPDGNTPEGED